MTPYVTQLLTRLVTSDWSIDRVADYGALIAYIEELERKAQLLDTHPGGHVMHHTGELRRQLSAS